MKAFRAAGLLFPWRHLKGPRKGEIDWKPLAHHAVLRVLHNPRYAGCFTYGRHAHRKQPGGKLNTTLLPREEWISFIPGAHPGYITLEQHDANLARLAANAAAHGRDRRSGPPREGPALLQGIIICGRCGLRMTVRYHRRARPVTGSPHLHVPARRHRERTPGLRRDPRRRTWTRPSGSCSSTPSPRSPSKPPCRCPPSSSTGPPKRTRCAPPTSNAPSTTPTWPAAATWPSTPPTGSSPTPSKPTGTPPCAPSATPRKPTTRPARSTPGSSPTPRRPGSSSWSPTCPRIWNDPATPARERKRIARLLLTDVTVTRTTDLITAHIRLAGGQDHTLTLAPPLPIGDQRRTPAEVVTAIDELLDQHTTGEIAGILNQRGLTSGTGEPFHRLIVDHIIRTYRLRSRRQRLRATGMLTLAEIAAAHGVHQQHDQSLAPSRNCQWHHGITTRESSSTTRPTPPTRPTAPRSAAAPSNP